MQAIFIVQLKIVPDKVLLGNRDSFTDSWGKVGVGEGEEIKLSQTYYVFKNKILFWPTGKMGIETTRGNAMLLLVIHVCPLQTKLRH